MPTVQTLTPPGTMTPIGPYNHIAKAGPMIIIGAVAGVDPATGHLAGPDAYTAGGTELPVPLNSPSSSIVEPAYTCGLWGSHAPQGTPIC